MSIRTWRGRELEARPHYVYRLYGEAGDLIYVGAAINVASRIEQHWGSLMQANPIRPSTWLTDVRDLTIDGPYDRKEALAVERDLIERHQPRGNIQYTARDPRPAIAIRSAARAEVSA